MKVLDRNNALVVELAQVDCAESAVANFSLGVEIVGGYLQLFECEYRREEIGCAVAV